MLIFFLRDTRNS